MPALLILAVFLSSCAPQIYGVRKHRKDRNCGCEYKIQEEQNCAEELTDINLETKRHKKSGTYRI